MMLEMKGSEPLLIFDVTNTTTVKLPSKEKNFV